MERRKEEAAFLQGLGKYGMTVEDEDWRGDFTV